jgi:F-type H+-transporting ATPase subunit alpha
MKNYTDYLEKIGEYGTTTQINFPLIAAKGLDNVHIDEIVISEDNEKGFVFNITQGKVEILLFSNQYVRVGTQFTRTNEYISIPVGEEYLGSVINPLGELYIKNKTYKQPKENRYINPPIKGIAERRRIRAPLETGVTMVDLTVPIGKGQKELIIGDRKSGKTSFILNVLKKIVSNDVVVVYAVIGKNKQEIKKLYEFCVEQHLEQKVVIVAASADSSPSLIYITPFSAMTIAEYFRDKGQNVLVILDDLSLHAKFYREISLLAQHFPGRESYPGDIFYNHAKLLERAGNFKYGDKDVSITCLPVVETVESDLSGYIATNVMGMTDGHIFFDSNAFYNGQRPAININLSVTRVGKQTQTSLQREINREITAFLNEYDKLKSYSHFGAELSSKVQKMLQKGDLMYVFFQQNYIHSVPIEVQTILFGFIWSSFIQKVEDVERLKTTLLEKYTEPLMQELVIKMNKSDSLYSFLTVLTLYKDQIFKMLDLPNPDAPVETGTNTTINNTKDNKTPTENTNQSSNKK